MDSNVQNAIQLYITDDKHVHADGYLNMIFNTLEAIRPG